MTTSWGQRHLLELHCWPVLYILGKKGSPRTVSIVRGHDPEITQRRRPQTHPRREAQPSLLCKSVGDFLNPTSCRAFGAGLNGEGSQIQWGTSRSVKPQWRRRRRRRREGNNKGQPHPGDPCWLPSKLSRPRVASCFLPLPALSS